MVVMEGWEHWWPSNRDFLDTGILRDAPPYCIYEDEKGFEETCEEAMQLLSEMENDDGDGVMAFPLHVLSPMHTDAKGNLITSEGVNKCKRREAEAEDLDDSGGDDGDDGDLTGNAKRGNELMPWGMQYILQAALDKNSQTATKRHYNANRLRTILLDARPHRSKWYDPQRPGQGELYDGLERVLSDLKTFVPHSIPFLHRVSKKEVPDYHLIIRRPMDLGTINKKLKDRAYRSKMEFVNDLNLIYDNCFTYNTQDDSPLRAAVRLLRGKWQLLLTKVPDITISEASLTSSVSDSSQQPSSDQRDESIDNILEEDFKIVLSDHSSDMEGHDDCAANVDKADARQEHEHEHEDGDDEDRQQHNHSHGHHHHHHEVPKNKHLNSLLPRRTSELMRAFRKTQHVLPPDLPASDYALFFNSLPDTRTLESRLQGKVDEHFNRQAFNDLLDCARIHCRLRSSNAKPLERVMISMGSVETPFSARRVSLKLATLILAAHGCEGTRSSVLISSRSVDDGPADHQRPTRKDSLGDRQNGHWRFLSGAGWCLPVKSLRHIAPSKRCPI